jgi:hypothetical protein
MCHISSRVVRPFFAQLEIELRCRHGGQHAPRDGDFVAQALQEDHGQSLGLFGCKH